MEFSIIDFFFNPSLIKLSKKNNFFHTPYYVKIPGLQFFQGWGGGLEIIALINFNYRGPFPYGWVKNLSSLFIEYL